MEIGWRLVGDWIEWMENGWKLERMKYMETKWRFDRENGDWSYITSCITRLAERRSDLKFFEPT